jgi:hypothetical protein
MIRWFFDVWAGTTHGLVVNVILAGFTIFAPINLFTNTIMFFTLAVLAVHFWGIAQGWQHENFKRKLEKQNE